MSRIWVLIVSALVALVVAMAGAYLVVVSQNPASEVNGPSALYGPSAP